VDVAAVLHHLRKPWHACRATVHSNIIGRRPNLGESHSGKRHTALDRVVAYLVTSVLKDVLNRGTGAGRARPPWLPSAGGGKNRQLRATRWFAGFTSTCLCVIWIGSTTIAISDLRAASCSPDPGQTS